jgi:hypothetical protein
MKKRDLLALIIISNCFMFCVEHKEKRDNPIEVVSPGESYLEKFNNQKMRDSLLTKIFVKGDTTSYKELKDIYFLSGHTEDFLTSAIIMATNHDYAEACKDAYKILYTANIDSTNLKSNKLANYYLLKAYELAPEKAIYLMRERFGESFPKIKSNDYWNEINK